MCSGAKVSRRNLPFHTDPSTCSFSGFFAASLGTLLALSFPIPSNGPERHRATFTLPFSFAYVATCDLPFLNYPLTTDMFYIPVCCRSFFSFQLYTSASGVAELFTDPSVVLDFFSWVGLKIQVSLVGLPGVVCRV